MSVFEIRLKELRENLGESQYVFAKRIGVAQSTVGNWESGVREPNFGTAIMLADLFDVSLDYLLGRTDVRAVATEEKPADALEPAAVPVKKAKCEPLTAQEIASIRKLLQKEGL